MIPWKSNQCETKIVSEAATSRFSAKWLFWRKLKNCQENICAWLYFSKVGQFWNWNFLKSWKSSKKTPSWMFHPVHSTTSLNKCRSSRSQMSFEIGVLKNFANFTGKHLSWSLFLIGLKRDSNIWKNFLKNFNYTSHYGKIQYRLLKEKYSHRISRTVLNSYCSNIKFLCFWDITINMYTWWLQKAWDFNLYTTVFRHPLAIKRSTNSPLCWSLIT